VPTAINVMLSRRGHVSKLLFDKIEKKTNQVTFVF
jgi:hypothetical protein